MNNVSRETGVIFVVEGKNDVAKLKSIDSNLNVLITNGSAVSTQLLAELEELSKNNRIVLLLDPDGPGEKIRRIISDAIIGVEHIFVSRNTAISKNKKKVGIEHMTMIDLKKALGNSKIISNQGILVTNQLYDLGLLGKRDSVNMRDFVCESLHIGKANGKTLLAKLNMFGVTYTELESIVRKYHDRKL